MYQLEMKPNVRADLELLCCELLRSASICKRMLKADGSTVSGWNTELGHLQAELNRKLREVRRDSTRIVFGSSNYFYEYKETEENVV